MTARGSGVKVGVKLGMRLGTDFVSPTVSRDGDTDLVSMVVC